MIDKEYQKLNDYLNGIFKRLERNDFVLLDHIEYFIDMSEAYVKMTNQYDLKNENKISKNLTFEDVYLLAREVIENINPLYLKVYDTLLTSGELDFSYDSEYNDSCFQRFYNENGEYELININREFTYNDVNTLVHEFMHKMNHHKRMTIRRYLLTEFISIYFEEYARKYLLEKGISKEELDFNERIRLTMRTASDFNWYSLILLVYEKVGKIDSESYQILNDLGWQISKEAFELECQKCLERLEKEEKQYRIDILYEKPFDENDMYLKLVKLCNTDYRYIFGTTLAFYALKNCDKDKLVYLNDHINDDIYTGMSFEDGLQTIGIDLEKIGINDFINIIEEQLKEGNKVKS